MPFDITNPAKPKIIHDPNAILDYSEGWALWLADDADTIASAEIVFPVGQSLGFDPLHPVAIVNDVQVIKNGITYPAGTLVTAWLTGGVPGNTETATFRITTVAGRKDDRTLYFSIKER